MHPEASLTYTVPPQALPRPNSTLHHDPEAIASWCHDPTTRTTVSYDSPEVATQKVAYIKRRGLGGAMWWESSGDFPVDHTDSLIRVTVEGLGGFEGKHLERRGNVLGYPRSRYENLRKGMPGE